jgi:putative PIN family toxin of toxin-antitoxin system
LVLSEHLLGEVDVVLAKPYFTQRLPAADRARFLQLLRRQGIITPLTAAVSGVATHPEDDLVLATALSGNARFLVTGDYKLLALKQHRDVIIVSVQEFLAMLPGLQSTGDQQIP